GSRFYFGQLARAAEAVQEYPQPTARGRGVCKRRGLFSFPSRLGAPNAIKAAPGRLRFQPTAAPPHFTTIAAVPKASHSGGRSCHGVESRHVRGLTRDSADPALALHEQRGRIS